MLVGKERFSENHAWPEMPQYWHAGVAGHTVIEASQGQLEARLADGGPPVDGLTNREIGDRLFLSPRTVSSHLYRSYPELGVVDRHQLRDVIARASTQTPTEEGAESSTFS